MSLAPNPFAIAADILVPQARDFEAHYKPWLETLFRQYTPYSMAPHHEDFWEHIDSLEPGVRPPAWFSVWGRGSAKSTSVELACVRLAARRTRRYGLYLSGNQDKADDHVGNVAGMFEQPAVAKLYPDLALPLKGKFGNSKGWRRNRIRTASGYTLDALGLDVAARGVKLDEQRPDHIILDDIDDLKDSPDTVLKKIDTITKGLLPAGSEDLAIFGAQNLIHKNGIFTRVVENRADFLKNRVVSGPIPALEHFEYEVRDEKYVITRGTPTWEGFGLKRCEELLNDIGPRAFKTECQHAVHEVEGALWRQAWIDDFRELLFIIDALDLTRCVVGVDPAVADNDESDETGIVVAGKSARNRHDYVLADRSCRVSPLEWAKRVAKAYDDFRADYVVAEANQGYELVRRNIQAIRPDIEVRLVRAKRGKELRAQPVANLYEQGRVHHVAKLMYPTDSLIELEAQMTSWVPGQNYSPDRVDALTYAISDLSVHPTTEQTTYTTVRRRR